MSIRLRQQIVRYLFLLKWLMLDFVWRFRWRVVLLLSVRFAGIGLQLATFLVLAHYASLLEGDRAVSILGATISARESVPLLAGVSCAALLAMILGSALTVFSSRWIERLVADYERFCSKRVLSIAARSFQLNGPTHVDMGTEQLVMKMTKRYTRLLRRMSKSLLTSLLPGLLVTMTVLPMLLWLNWWLTLIVAALVATSLALHYRLNVRAAQSSLTMERTASDSSREFKSLVHRIAQSMEPLDEDAIGQPFRSLPVRRNYDAYFTRVTATNESQFITDCFSAVILAIVLITLGGSILRNGEGWAALLVYLLALRYSLGQVRGTLSAFAGMNRYFHQARAYFQFVSDNRTNAPPDRGAEAPLTSLDVRASDSPLEGSRQRATIDPGKRVAVIGPFKPTRFQIRLLFGALFGESDRALHAAMACTELIPDLDALDLRLRGIGTRDIAANPNGSDQSAPETRFHAGLSIVVVSEKAIRHMRRRDGNDAASNAVTIESDQVLLALVGNMNLLEQVDFDMVIVTDGDRVNWIGDPAAFAKISNLFEQQRARANASHDADDDSSDLDDEYNELL